MKISTKLSWHSSGNPTLVQKLSCFLQTHYFKMTTSDMPEGKAFLNSVGKGENSLPPFSRSAFYPMKDKFNVLSNI